MTNILDSAKGLISMYTDDEPKGPLHVGEVMSVWTYHTMLTEINRFVEMALNTTTDDELKEALKNSYDDCQKQAKEIEALLMKEGINVPSTTEHKPQSNPEGVPLGAKMSDAEIANGIAVKQVSALTFCATGLAQSIRGDIANMWVRFFMKRVNYGAYFIPLIRKRGWINVLPYYYPPGAPRHS